MRDPDALCSRQVSIVALGVWIFLLGTMALSQEPPYYVVNETFALSQDIFDGRNKITAFLPRRYLLYIEDRESTETISGKEYVAALTQDGVEVFVLESDVSDSVFSQSVGSHEIIFNSAFDDLVCKDSTCQGNEEERYWKISRGDAFKIQSESDTGLLTIKGSDNIIGYVGEQAIDTMIKKGFVTRVDDQHPRYTIDRTTVESLTTRCSSKIGDLVDVGSERPMVQKVLDQVRIGQWDAADQKLRVTISYGGDNEKVEFRVYEIEDRKAESPEPDRFWVVAAITYDCELKDFGREDLNFIKKVSFHSSRTEEVFELSIEESPFETPQDLAEYTGAPYLVSINSYEHFEAVISALSEKLNDRALAGYALAELNRSCIYRERRSGGKCRGHSYPKVD